MRAVLYARFSSDNQREESITAQLRASRSYCKAKGYTVIREYKDEAKSGTTVAGREGFQQMILDSGDNLFDVVVFHKIDRAARNEIDYYANMSRLERNGVSYEYSAEGIDTSTVNGKLTEGIKVAVAAWYSRNLSLETKKGKRETALQCKFNGGFAPLGYDIVDGRYVINETEAVAVRKIFELKANGEGYSAIIEWLNAHGYRTKRGGFFGKNSIHDILNNKRYTGVYQYAKGTKHNPHGVNMDLIEIEDGIPRIIDDYTWNKVEKIRSERKNGANTAKVVYALRGKIYCECGGVFSGQSSGDDKHKYHHYVCRNKYYKHMPCNTKRLEKKFVEELVAENILNEIRSNKQEIINEFNKLNIHSQNEETKKALAQRISKQEQKVERLLNLYAEDGDSTMLGQYRKAKEELAMLKKEYSELKVENGVDLAQVEEFLDTMSNMTFTEAEYKEIFDLFIDRIIVHEDTLELKMTIKVIPKVVALTRIIPLYKCA